VEDSDNEHIYHSESWLLARGMMREPEGHRLAFTIPIFEPLPSQYYVRAVSDGWLGAEALLTVSFKGLILPERMPPHTELLDLDPLPLAALGVPEYEALYAGRFTHFNPIQTQARGGAAAAAAATRRRRCCLAPPRAQTSFSAQCSQSRTFLTRPYNTPVQQTVRQAFHTLYHTDESVLLGAPTGSGKTVTSELCMLRVFSAHPGASPGGLWGLCKAEGLVVLGGVRLACAAIVLQPARHFPPIPRR